MARGRPEKIPDLLRVVVKCVEESRFVETVHAKERQKTRKIILPDLLYVLKNGAHEKQKDKFDEAYQTWNYAIRGFAPNKEDMRVIISFDEEEMLLIITAFYIESKRA